MSPIDPSMMPMLDTFVFETTTLLEQLDEILLGAERAGPGRGERKRDLPDHAYH